MTGSTRATGSDRVADGAPAYTLGLFANMYPAFDGDYRGIFIRQMVRDLETRGVVVRKAVKTNPSVTGYAPFLWQSHRLCRDRDLDLMQAEYIPHSSLVPVYFGRKDIPLILKFHGDDARIYPFENRFNLSLTKSMFRYAAHVITGSEEMKRILVGLGEDSDHISAIHTGVDTTFFTPLDRDECRRLLGLPAGVPLFLFVGRFHPWKGISELVATARELPSVSFIFIGPGTVPDHTPNCRFLPAQPPEVVRTWMNAADCLVLPTYTESVPTVVMESSACGIPSIATDVGGCPEIVEPGKSGLLVPARDAGKLRDAIAWMADHPGERARMGKEARAIAVGRYNHNHLTDRLVALHRRCLS